MRTVGLLAMILVMLALAAASAAAAPTDAPCAHGAVDDPACVGYGTLPDAQPAAGRWNQTAAGTTIDDSQVLAFLAGLQVHADGEGAVVTYNRFLPVVGGGNSYQQVFAQRLNSAGAKQWGANGTQVFAIMDGIVQAATLALQVFATGRIATRLGVTTLLVIVPLAMIAGFLGLAEQFVARADWRIRGGRGRQGWFCGDPCRGVDEDADLHRPFAADRDGGWLVFHGDVLPDLPAFVAASSGRDL